MAKRREKKEIKVFGEAKTSNSKSKLGALVKELNVDILALPRSANDFVDQVRDMHHDVNGLLTSLDVEVDTHGDEVKKTLNTEQVKKHQQEVKVFYDHDSFKGKGKLTSRDVHDILLLKSGGLGVISRERRAELESKASYVVIRGTVTQYLEPYGVLHKPIERVVYYTSFPKLAEDSKDLQEFCEEDGKGEYRIKDQDGLRQKFQDMLKLQIRIAASHDEGLDIIIPDSFLAALNEKEQVKAKKLFAEVIVEEAQHQHDGFKGLFIHDSTMADVIEVTKEKKKKFKFPVIYNSDQNSTPQLMATHYGEEINVAESIISSPLTPVGNKALLHGEKTQEEWAYLLTGGELGLVFNPKYNGHLFENIHSISLGNKTKKVGPWEVVNALFDDRVASASEGPSVDSSDIAVIKGVAVNQEAIRYCNFIKKQGDTNSKLQSREECEAFKDLSKKLRTVRDDEELVTGKQSAYGEDDVREYNIGLTRDLKLEKGEDGKYSILNGERVLEAIQKSGKSVRISIPNLGVDNRPLPDSLSSFTTIVFSKSGVAVFPPFSDVNTDLLGRIPLTHETHQWLINKVQEQTKQVAIGDHEKVLITDNSEGYMPYSPTSKETASKEPLSLDAFANPLYYNSVSSIYDPASSSNESREGAYENDDIAQVASPLKGSSYVNAHGSVGKENASPAKVRRIKNPLYSSSGSLSDSYHVYYDINEVEQQDVDQAAQGLSKGLRHEYEDLLPVAKEGEGDEELEPGLKHAAKKLRVAMKTKGKTDSMKSTDSEGSVWVTSALYKSPDSVDPNI